MILILQENFTTKYTNMGSPAALGGYRSAELGPVEVRGHEGPKQRNGIGEVSYRGGEGAGLQNGLSHRGGSAGGVEHES